MAVEYKLPVRRQENYSGEHREWVEEYILPDWLVQEIQQDALSMRMVDREQLADLIRKHHGTTYGEDGTWAGTVEHHGHYQAADAILAALSSTPVDQQEGGA